MRNNIPALLVLTLQPLCLRLYSVTLISSKNCFPSSQYSVDNERIRVITCCYQTLCRLEAAELVLIQSILVVIKCRSHGSEETKIFRVSINYVVWKLQNW